MGKNKRRRSTTGARTGKPKAATRTAHTRQTSPSTPVTPGPTETGARGGISWRGIATRVGALLGVAASIVAFFGPFWPLAPIVVPDAPSDTDAFTALFLVKNPSEYYDIAPVTYTCTLHKILTDRNFEYAGFNLTDSLIRLPRNVSTPLVCPFKSFFGENMGRVTAAKISITFEYKVFGLFSRRIESPSFQWTDKLKPSRWIQVPE